MEGEEEGEKENEDLCNEGGTPVPKAKRKRKRKNEQSASTMEPHDKKNKADKKSSEQGTTAFCHICFLLPKTYSTYLRLLDCCLPLYDSWLPFLFNQMKPAYLNMLRRHFLMIMRIQNCKITYTILSLLCIHF